MKTLYLLRHARSGRQEPGGDDHERSLEARGERAAAAMGAHLGRREHRPTLVLCSSARRGVQTLEQLLPHLGENPRVSIERGLYLASRGQLLSRLAGVEDRDDSVLVIGHNPDLAALALGLAGAGDPQALRRLGQRFPTAALAILGFDVERWGDVALGGGRLLDFTTPEDLVPPR